MSLVFGCADPILQKALLELCFSEDQPHDSSFWQTRVTILDHALIADRLSGEQLRMLPLLYRKNSLEGLSSTSRNKIISIYKHTLCRNSLMVSRIADLQKHFDAAGFAPMIALKGMPTLAYLRLGLGARPMADVDVLVPGMQKRPQDIMAILTSLGFTKKASGFRSVTVLSPEGLEFDIHWYLHDWASGHDLVQMVSEYAQRHVLLSQNFLIPCVEHHLAHVLAHGILTKTLTFDARWLVDFLSIYETVPTIDIDRFAVFVNKLAAPQRLRDAIFSLDTELPETIDIDRSQLRAMKSAIQTNHRFMTWLYTQTPTPNLPPHMLGPHPRSDRLKGALIEWIVNPWRLWMLHRISVLEYWRWKADFPPPGKLGGINAFLKRLLLRGSVFVYRLVRQR